MKVTPDLGPSPDGLIDKQAQRWTLLDLTPRVPGNRRSTCVHQAANSVAHPLHKELTGRQPSGSELWTSRVPARDAAGSGPWHVSEMAKDRNEPFCRLYSDFLNFVPP